MYRNNTERSGRPNLDMCIVMLKLLFIQQLYSSLMSCFNAKSPIASSFECFLIQRRTFLIPERYGSLESALLTKAWIRKYGWDAKAAWCNEPQGAKGSRAGCNIITADPVAMGKQILFAAIKQKPGEAKMGLWRRKKPDPFSDTSWRIAWMIDLFSTVGSPGKRSPV